MDLKNKFLLPLFYQMTRFATVGVVAAVVHFSLVVLLVEFCFLHPLYANVIAFFLAFQVSYFGHRYWTFKGTSARHQTALPKLLLISSLCFVVNEGLFYILLTL